MPVVDNGSRGYKIIIPSKYDESKKNKPQNVQLNKNESIFSTEQDQAESKMQIKDTVSIRNIKNLIDSSAEQIRYSQKNARAVKKNPSATQYDFQRSNKVLKDQVRLEPLNQNSQHMTNIFKNSSSKHNFVPHLDSKSTYNHEDKIHVQKVKLRNVNHKRFKSIDPVVPPKVEQSKEVSLNNALKFAYKYTQRHSVFQDKAFGDNRFKSPVAIEFDADQGNDRVKEVHAAYGAKLSPLNKKQFTRTKLQPVDRMEQDANMAHFFRERDQIDKNIQDILKNNDAARKHQQWQSLFDHPKIAQDPETKKKKQITSVGAK